MDRSPFCNRNGSQFAEEGLSQGNSFLTLSRLKDGGRLNELERLAMRVNSALGQSGWSFLRPLMAHGFHLNGPLRPHHGTEAIYEIGFTHLSCLCEPLDRFFIFEVLGFQPDHVLKERLVHL